MRFAGKTAVVTGAAQGIGEAIAGYLYEQGIDKVALLDLNEDKVRSAASALDPKGDRAIAFACDVSSSESTKRVFGEIEALFGHVDILVNNAGITRDAIFHKMTEEQWLSVLNVNLNSMFYCCQAVIAGMRERKYGKIVNLASVSAFGNLGQTNYGAAKAGVIGFTKCLARDVARSGITVNCVAPSYINTDMLRAVPEATMQRFLSAIPMERLGEPQELAAAVGFLCSDDSSFVTGECLVVSGGSYM
ncbi:MAG TPA: beta-ketoacyl-ACP reductase [Candidatus Limiplasma sp.]|nr:beta-ketoacyl-ACP reductase [Candidatus Limiplasma sp.]HRX08351.1 beta-ketoacyl-ACP reductase [Candidatus Limiplasma sp.]